MNLIQVLFKLLLTFAGSKANSQEVKAILSIVLAVADILMQEIHLREKSGTDESVRRPFHIGTVDRIFELDEPGEMSPNKANLEDVAQFLLNNDGSSKSN